MSVAKFENVGWPHQNTFSHWPVCEYSNEFLIMLLLMFYCTYSPNETQVELVEALVFLHKYWTCWIILTFLFQYMNTAVLLASGKWYSYYYLGKTRQVIYYHNIASTISCHAVSKRKTLVEACQISYITNQILQIISKKQRKKKEQICVVNSKARKTNLFNATCERSYKV